MNARKALLVLVAAISVAALILHVSPVRTARAAASQQVVFSGTGIFADGTQPITPFGFWIWCEAASTNPYQGACNGAMYFYAFGITKHVSGSVSGSGQQFTMTVASADNAVKCKLTNGTPVLSGPANMVTATCTAPAQVDNTFDSDITGVSMNAVVNITGPGN